jgi:membrane-associated phospholipid phosphatase
MADQEDEGNLRQSEEPEQEVVGQVPLFPVPPGIMRHLLKVRRTHVIRFAIAIALIAVSAVTNRGFLGWGLLFVLGVLVVPVGRARSFLIAFVPYAGVWFVFTAFRSLADETIFARTLNLHVAEFERELFDGRIPTLRLQDKYFEPGTAGWIDYFLTAIHWSYFIVPHVAAVLIWYKRPDIFRRFLTGMALMLATGLAIYFLIPTNPPWLAPEPINSPSAAVVYRIMETVGQELGGGIYEASYRVIGESNPRAAMPSIHMAFTALLIFPAFRFSRRWGYAAAIYTGLMGLALVYLGEHYVIDLFVGIVCAAWGWYAAGAWLDIAAPVVRQRRSEATVAQPPRERPGAQAPQPLT